MPPFRAEILGLRGLAVLAVLLFHTTPTTLPGGFLGVDVFLVLSGYLITAQLQHQFDNATFSLFAFYARRVFRLLPSLLATYAAYLPFCFRMYAPMDLRVIFQSVLAGVFGFANVFFASISGYFSKDLSVKPFLHTWSLSLEMQFYFSWPLVMLLFRKMFSRTSHVRLLTFSFCLGSLLAAQLTSQREAAFFYLPFRLFEFMVGSLLAFSPEVSLDKVLGRAVTNLTSILALLTLLAITVFCDDTVHLPGLVSLIPCLSTAVLIAAGSGPLTGKLLSARPLAFLGRISYSLYLFHWPLIVLVNYAFETGNYDLLRKCAFWAASVGLGWLNYRFVERSTAIRKASGTGGGTRNRVLAAAATVLIAFTLFASYRAIENMSSTTHAGEEGHYLSALRDEVDRSWTNISLGTDPYKFSAIGAVNSTRRFIIIGDSFAGHLHYFMHYVGLRYNLSFALWWHKFCTPLYDLPAGQQALLEGGFVGTTTQCARFRQAWKEVAGGFDGVVFGGRWAQRTNLKSRVVNASGLAASPFVGRMNRTDGAMVTGLAFRMQLAASVRYFRERGLKVLLVSDPPVVGIELVKCRKVLSEAVRDAGLRRTILSGRQPRECVWEERGKWQAQTVVGEGILEEVAREEGAAVAMLGGFLCDNEREDARFCRVVHGLELLFGDPRHVSTEGSLYLASRWVADESGRRVLKDFFGVGGGR